jgi:hypothetical protein
MDRTLTIKHGEMETKFSDLDETGEMEIETTAHDFYWLGKIPVHIL